MSPELCILASGSSGNSTILRTPGGIVLIDAGIGPRTAAARMNGTGIGIGDVRAICLTHLDRDHFSRNWLETLARRGISLFCHENRLNELHEMIGDAKVAIHTFNGRSFQPIDEVYFRA